MRRMHTDKEITNLVEENPSVKTALALATETAKTYKTAELVLNSSDFEATFDAKTTAYETSDPEEPELINALLGADLIIIFSAGASGTAKEDPHFFRKMRYSETEETAYFECFEMDTGKLYHYEMSVSSVDEGGEITITPLKTFEPLMSDIVDADGHKRFQEWDLTIPTLPEGVTSTYAKASLSGTHLMIVLALSFANASEVPSNAELASVELPSWIMNKIVPVWSSNWIEVKTATLRADDWSAQALSMGLTKASATTLKILNVGSGLALTANRKTRMQFDLLID